MGFNNFYPYTDFNELNLDWILKTIKELMHVVDDFTALQSIKWMGDWSIDKQYPPWSIVADGADGYISIKPVPKGVEITNTDYWSKIANYDVLYSAFEERIHTLENEMSDVDDSIDGINDSIETLNTTIGDVSELETSDTSNLVNAINSLVPTTKKYLFIGDSYAQLSWGSWIDVCATRLGLTSSDYYEQKEGGAGFNRNGSGGHNYNDLLNIAYSNIESPNDITDIIIGGGVNDAYDETVEGVPTAINTFVTNAKSKFPNAMIYLGFYGISTRSDINHNLAKAISSYQAIDSIIGCTYLNGVENVAHDAYRIGGGADRVHPDLVGLTAIGNAMANAYLYGFASCTREKNIGDSRNLSAKIYRVFQKDGTIGIKLTGAYTLIEVNNITINGIGNNDLHVADMEFSFFSPCAKETKIPIMCEIVYDTTTAPKKAMLGGYLYMDYYTYSESETRQGLYLNLFSFGAPSGVVNYANVSKIYVLPFEYTTTIGQA